MKAAVYCGPRDIQVKDVATPGIKANEILVKVHACGICGSDLHAYRIGMFEESLGRPLDEGLIMGHEFSGEVVEAGSEVEKFQVGDRVTGGGMGGFAEFISVAVDAKRPHLLPDTVSFEEGAMMEPLATSVHAVGLAKPTDGETVVILGVGIIGLGCIQVIRATAGGRIIAVDASERRLEMAQQLGADEVVNLTEVDPVEAVIEYTGGERPVEKFGVRGGNADVVIDSAGARASLNQGLTMLKQQNGRLVPVALFEDQPDLDVNQVVRKQVALQGSWAWTADDYLRGIKLVESGKIDREPLISHVFSLDEAPEAFATQARPDAAIKTLLKP